MTKKFFLVSFVLILIVAGIVGGVMAAQAAQSGQTTGGYRLFGFGMDGAFGMPTAPNVPPTAPPYYRVALGFRFVNPDLTYSKTIWQILIIDDSDNVIQVPLPTGGLILGPRKGFGRDFPQLGMGPTGLYQNHYAIEVYWVGRGEPLMGWITENSWLMEELSLGNWQAKDLGPIQFEKEMVNLSR